MDNATRDLLLPALIDHYATASPDRVFAFLPKGPQLEDGFFPLTYSALAKAVDATAWWLDQEFKATSDGTTQTFPYIGANDFRYVLLFHACLKSGRCFMTPLTFNTTEGLVKLLGDCTTVFTSENNHHHWTGAKTHVPDLRIIEVPPMEALIHDAPVPKYPCTRKYTECIDTVAYKIQSSGTTGSPRVIELVMEQLHWAVQTAKHNDKFGENEKLALPSLYQGDCYVPSVLPLSWAAGLTFIAAAPLGFGNIPIMLPSTAPQPTTAEYVSQVNLLAPRGKKNGLAWIPSGLRQLVELPGGLDGMKHYDWVVYAGAPLDHTTGDKIASVTRVQSNMGDTSLGVHPLLLNDPSDWKIHRMSPHAGHFFEHFTDEFYELCVRRQARDCRSAFRSDPAMEVYHTRDLWRKVEGRPGFWETAGRKDDFVKLSSMTKFNAIELEHRLESHPGISRALVAGDGKTRPFAIVELGDGVSRSKRRPDEVVTEALAIANAKVWGEVQLREDLVVVADAARPIRRTDKGSTDRRNTIAMYSEQIDELYRQAGLEQ